MTKKQSKLTLAGMFVAFNSRRNKLLVALALGIVVA